MKEEQISTGYTVILQGVLGSFIILLSTLIGLLLRNTTLDTTAWIIIICIILFIIIVAWRLSLFADVYVSSDQVICKKIIGIKRQPLSTVRSVNEGLLPFNYYIEFMNDKKVYFQLKPGDMLRRFTESDANGVLHTLREKLKLEQ